MKRNYEIVHYARDDEWAIRKVNNEETWWLSNNNGKPAWTYKEEWARRFFHKETAMSALAVVKTKQWEIKEEWCIQEKQSWSEF